MTTFVRLDIWGVDRRGIPSAMVAMARERQPLRRIPGLSFAKLLGTGSGQTFSVRDVDFHHWAVLTCWSHASAAAEFEDSSTIRRWRARSNEHLHVELTPLASHGTWAGVEPFATAQPPGSWQAPVAAITRARLRIKAAPQFWRAAPGVANSAHQQDGLLFALGIGEAPIGFQGTFSVWKDAAALRQFAYQTPEHTSVIEDSKRRRWYTEDLFARFGVTSMHGTFDGRELAIATNPDS